MTHDRLPAMLPIDTVVDIVDRLREATQALRRTFELIEADLGRGDLDGIRHAVKTVVNDCAGVCAALDELRQDLGLEPDDRNVRH